MILWLALGAVVLAVLAALMWTIVKPDEVHVVVQRGSIHTYSGHVTADGSVTKYSTTGKSAYFRIPEWIPFFGMNVTIISLTMIRIPVTEFLAFDIDRVRFNCDISANLSVDDPIRAAQRFPKSGRYIDWEALHAQITDVIKESIRDTTTKSKIHKIINEREAVSKQIQVSTKDTVEKWGLCLQVLNLTDIKDAHDIKDSKGRILQPVQDISSIREMEINAEARRKNALQDKEARLKEAEADEFAQKREIQRDREVGVAQQKQDEDIKVAEQKKAQNVNVQRKATQEKEMDVERVKQVKLAEIEKDRIKVNAEAQKQKLAIEAEGFKQQEQLHGEGEGKKAEMIGRGEGAAIEAKGLAEAKVLDEKQKALNQFGDNAVAALVAEKVVEKDRQVGIAGAKALESADLKVFSGGESAASGFNVGQLVDAIKTGDRGAAKSFLNRFARPNDLGFKNLDELVDNLLEYKTPTIAPTTADKPKRKFTKDGKKA